MVASWDDPAPVWFDPLRDPSGPGWHLDRRRFDDSLGPPPSLLARCCSRAAGDWRSAAGMGNGNCALRGLGRAIVPRC